MDAAARVHCWGKRVSARSVERAMALIPSGAFFRQLSARAGPVTALCLQFECHAEMAEMTCVSRDSAKLP